MADATARRPPKPLAPKRPTITVVVPTLNEAGNVRRAVESARACASTSGRAPEVIVVDGGSEDDTVAEARAAGAAVLSAPRGRASQCNAARAPRRATYSSSCTPTPRSRPHTTSTSSARSGTMRRTAGDASGARSGSRSTATTAAARRDWRLGARARDGVSLYDLVCSYPSGPRRWLLEAAVNVRTAVFRRPYGDQGLLVRKTRFDALGGFASMPFLEDVELVSRLKRRGAGAPAILNASVTTSARRFERVGYVRTSLLNQAIVLGYACGVPVERLRARYAAARRRGGDAGSR